MSQLHPRARRLAMAGATLLTAAAVVTPAHAATRTLDYRCKYPLIGVQPVTLEIDAPSPANARVGEATSPVPVSATATLGGNTALGFVLIEGLKSIAGAMTFGSTLEPQGGVAFPVKVPLALTPFTRTDINAPIPEPMTFSADGNVPSLAIEDMGPADLSLTTFAMNLTAFDAAGVPIVLPPITKDIDQRPVTQSDTDEDTFDVYCKLDAGQLETDYLTYNVGDVPIPTTPDTAAPSSPGSPSTSELTPNSVKLSWGASTDEPGGSGLKRYLVRFAGREVAVSSGATSTVLTGLAPATAYDFSIVAIDRANNASEPAHVTVTTPPKPNEPPTAPTNLAASVSGDTVALAWTASTDDVGVAGYSVYSDGAKVATVTSPNASVSGLANGQHLFSVQAFDAEGLTSTSQIITATVGGGGSGQTTTYKCKYPLVGTNPLSLNVTIDAPSTWPSGTPTQPFAITAALILGGNTSPGFSVIDGLAKLEGEVKLTLGVTLPNGGPKIVVKTPLALAPYTVATPVQDPVVLQASGVTPSLTFDDPGVSRATVDGLALNLRMRDASGNAIILPAVTTDIVGTPVAPSDDDPETFDVYCKIDAGQQPIAAFELTTVPDEPGSDVTAPSRPGEGDFTLADFTATSINLKWTASIDNAGGSGVKEYLIVCGDREFRVPAGTLSKLLTGLSQDSEYFCLISAIDNAGNRSEPLELLLVTPVAPLDTQAPTPPVVSCGSSAPGSITLSWTASTDNVGVVGYSVSVATDIILEVTGTSVTLPLPTFLSYTARVVAKDAAGNRSVAGTAICKAQPPTTTPTTPPPSPSPLIKYSYSLAGSATLKTLTKGTLPLKGSIDDANLTLATGQFLANLSLAQTQGRLTALGFLPVTAKIGFVPSGKTTGTLLDGVLKTNSKVRIKVQEVKLFGAIPLAGGNNCQTKQLSDINLTSTQAEFNPLRGGPLAGTFAISDLNGCGALNGLVSPLTAGAGNTIALNLTPKTGTGSTGANPA